MTRARAKSGGAAFLVTVAQLTSAQMNSTDINVNEELSKICLRSGHVVQISFTSPFPDVSVSRFYEYLSSIKTAHSQRRYCFFYYSSEMEVVIFTHVRL